MEQMKTGVPSKPCGQTNINLGRDTTIVLRYRLRMVVPVRARMWKIPTRKIRAKPGRDVVSKIQTQ